MLLCVQNIWVIVMNDELGICIGLVLSAVLCFALEWLGGGEDW